jgi:hypothetical protein
VSFFFFQFFCFFFKNTVQSHFLWSYSSRICIIRTKQDGGGRGVLNCWPMGCTNTYLPCCRTTTSTSNFLPWVLGPVCRPTGGCPTSSSSTSTPLAPSAPALKVPIRTGAAASFTNIFISRKKTIFLFYTDAYRFRYK